MGGLLAREGRRESGYAVGMNRYDDPENVKALFFFYGLVGGTLAAIFGTVWLVAWLLA